MVTGEPFYPGGKVPPLTLASFSEVHDYCDANELGGLCDDAITEQANRLFPDRTDADTLATQGWMEISNRVQMLADEWISTAQPVFRSGEWCDRTQVVGKYREAIPAFGELDIEVPVGWWDVTEPNDGCPNFGCGFYRLWTDSKQSALSGGTPRFILELLDENLEQVRLIMSSDDWIDMQACIATLPPSRDYLQAERDHSIRAAAHAEPAMERVSLVRVHTKEVGTRHYEAITVVVGDLHLSCDWMNARQLRLAKRLADSHGAPFQVAPELLDRVERELDRGPASESAGRGRALEEARR